MHFLSSSYENHLAPFSCGAPPLSLPLDAQDAEQKNIYTYINISMKIHKEMAETKKSTKWFAQ